MAVPVPQYCPTFSTEQLDQCRDVARRRGAPHIEVLRAKLAEMVHDNPQLPIPETAERLGMSDRWVRKWRKRWTQDGFSLEDRPRSGRPPTFSPQAGDGDQGDSLRAACSA